MSSEIIDPSGGMPGGAEKPRESHPEGKPSSSDDSLPAAPPDHPPGMGPPVGSGTSSADGLSLPLSQLSPDPLLGEFKPEPSAPAAGSSTPAFDALDLDVPPSAEPPPAGEVNSGVLAVVAAINLDPKAPAARERDQNARPDEPAAGQGTASTPAESLMGLDLYAPPPTIKTGAEAEPALGASEDEDDDHAARGLSWPLVLLGSYASAVTLGLLWVLWGHRVPRDVAGVEADPFPPADTRPDPGHRAGQSRRSVAPPLPADRVLDLGQTLKVGSLEVTPLEVASGPVILRREISKVERRRGGDGALMLKLRLKNLSADSILVPLDEAFIRERGRGIRDSFIQTGPTSQIDMYPLAVVSEWSIVGQEFRELRPGEGYETWVVSAADALGRLAPEMTWRLRLRTDINQTETIGVRFRANDVHKLPRAPRPEPAAPDPEMSDG